MPNSTYLRAALALPLILAFTVTGGTQPVSRDRILGAIDAAQTAAVRHTAHPLARPQFDQGRLDPAQRLSGVALTFRLSSAQQADLNQLLRDQQDRSSPLYHKWLTPDQYAARFGMTQADLAKVTAWAQSQGLTVEAISRDHNEISVSGSVGQIEYALNTELHNYSINGERHFANATDVALPAAFASQVLGVRGLDDFHPKPRLRRASPQFTSSISGNHFLIPGDFATIYDLTPLYAMGLDGAGQTIAVVGQTTISLSDIDAFRSASGLSKFDPTVVQVPNTGSAALCSGDLGEADLDLEWSGAVAKNAGIIYVFAGVGTGGSCVNRFSDVFDALHYAITAHIAPVISISYGNCEANLTGGFPLTVQQWAQQANAQGQTISGPSADNAAADCDFGVQSATHGLAVDVPASIPEVTGVGGTEFTGDSPAIVSGVCAPANPPYWSGSCSPTSGASALTYIPEMSWNDTAASIASTPPGPLDGSGGGASTIFSKPVWQTGPGVPADGQRDVPDIALNASNFHDPYLICSAGSCTNGFRNASNGLNGIGGTSAGAPSFAGILAILNQATQLSGQGNVNPNLYSLAAGMTTSSAFHDIPAGSNNIVPCTPASTGCPVSHMIGFSTTANYDQVTGLGSVDAFNLVTDWPTFSSSQMFNVGASPTILTIASVGQNAQTSVIVGGTNGFTGTVTMSCAVPAGSTAKISCSVTPPQISLTSSTTSGTATLTINALAASGAVQHRRLEFLAAGLMIPGILFLTPLRRRKTLFGLVVLGGLGVALGCGGGSSTPPPPPPPPPPVTYVVSVTGTSGVAHSVNVTVTAP
jgi:subtilase family serine protease